jgi:hypothetical protein
MDMHETSANTTQVVFSMLTPVCFFVFLRKAVRASRKQFSLEYLPMSGMAIFAAVEIYDTSVHSSGGVAHAQASRRVRSGNVLSDG